MMFAFSAETSPLSPNEVNILHHLIGLDLKEIQ